MRCVPRAKAQQQQSRRQLSRERETETTRSEQRIHHVTQQIDHEKSTQYSMRTRHGEVSHLPTLLYYPSLNVHLVGHPQGRVGHPKGGRVKIFAIFFSFSHSPFSLFLFLSLEFWLCWKRWSPKMCTFGVLWAQTDTFTGPNLRKHHQNSTRRYPERKKKTKWEWERDTKSEILGRSDGGCRAEGSGVGGSNVGWARSTTTTQQHNTTTQHNNNTTT